MLDFGAKSWQKELQKEPKVLPPKKASSMLDPFLDHFGDAKRSRLAKCWGFFWDQKGAKSVPKICKKTSLIFDTLLERFGEAKVIKNQGFFFSKTSLERACTKVGAEKGDIEFTQ